MCDEVKLLKSERQNMVTVSESQSAKINQLLKESESGEKFISDLSKERRIPPFEGRRSQEKANINNGDIIKENERLKEDMKRLHEDLVTRDEKLRLLENESTLVNHIRAKLSLTEYENRNLKNALFEMRKQLESELANSNRRSSFVSLNRQNSAQTIDIGGESEVDNLKAKVNRLERKAEMLMLSRNEMMTEMESLRKSEKRRSSQTLPVLRSQRYSRNGYATNRRNRSYSQNSQFHGGEKATKATNTDSGEQLDKEDNERGYYNPRGCHKDEPLRVHHGTILREEGNQTPTFEPLFFMAVVRNSVNKCFDSRYLAVEKNETLLLVGHETADGHFMAFNRRGSKGIVPSKIIRVVNEIKYPDFCFWANGNKKPAITKSICSIPKPGDLQVMDENPRQIKVTWKPPVKLPSLSVIFEYEIVIDERLHKNVERTQTSAVFDDIDLSKPHRICVLLKSKYGISKRNDCTQVFGIGSQLKPDQIGLKYINSQSVLVSWRPPSNLLSHIILLDEKHVCTAQPGTNKIKLIGLSEQKQYHLTIRPDTDEGISGEVVFDLASLNLPQSSLLPASKRIQSPDNVSTKKSETVLERSNSVSSGQIRSRTEPTRRTTQSRARLFVALYDYLPLEMSPNLESCHEELTFKEGQLIKIYGEIGQDGFYVGETTGQRGYVPSNMIEEVKITDPDVWMHLMNEFNRQERHDSNSRSRTVSSTTLSKASIQPQPSDTGLKTAKQKANVQRCVSSQEIREITPKQQHKPGLTGTKQSSLPNISREVAPQQDMPVQIGHVAGAWISSQMPKWNIFDRLKERITQWDNL
ncbi:hypothetical protein ACOME3_008113 [Neoechinorhynchus agilis]